MSEPIHLSSSPQLPKATCTPDLVTVQRYLLRSSALQENPSDFLQKIPPTVKHVVAYLGQKKATAAYEDQFVSLETSKTASQLPEILYFPDSKALQRCLLKNSSLQANHSHLVQNIPLVVKNVAQHFANKEAISQEHQLACMNFLQQHQQTTKLPTKVRQAFNHDLWNQLRSCSCEKPANAPRELSKESFWHFLSE